MIVEIALAIVLAIVIIALFPFILAFGIFALVLLAIGALLYYLFTEGNDILSTLAGVVTVAVIFGVIVNIKNSIRESGGFWLFSKYLLLKTEPAFTIKQKSNKNIKLEEFEKIIQEAVEQKSKALKEKYLNIFNKKAENKLKRYRKYNYLNIKNIENKLYISIANPNNQDLPAYIMRLGVKYDFPKDSEPTYYYENLKNWDNPISFEFDDLNSEQYSKSITEISTNIKKLIKKIIIEYETAIGKKKDIN